LEAAKIVGKSKGYYPPLKDWKSTYRTKSGSIIIGKRGGGKPREYYFQMIQRDLLKRREEIVHEIQLVLSEWNLGPLTASKRTLEIHAGLVFEAIFTSDETTNIELDRLYAQLAEVESVLNEILSYSPTTPLSCNIGIALSGSDSHSRET
jgi:hypothetical protein